MDPELSLQPEGVTTEDLGSLESQAQEAPVAANPDSWESDKRYESMWRRDPNNLYRSYKEMEKGYEPLKSRVSEYERQVAELKKYKEEQSQFEPWINYIQQLASHPRFSGDLQSFVQDINQKMRQEKFGDLPDDVIKQLELGVQAHEKLQEVEKKEAYEKEVSSYENVLKDISAFCEENDIDWSNEMMNEFIKFAQSQGVQNPHHLESLFYRHAHPAIKKALLEKGQNAVVANLNKNKAAVIPSAPSSRKLASTSSASLEDRLRASL